MKRLTSQNLWAHCSNKVPSLKAPAVGLGRSKSISYKKALENAKNKTAGSPYMGLIFGDSSEYIGLDVDVDPSGKKQNATTEIPPAVLFFIHTHPTHVHYSPSGHGIHIIYRLSKKTQKELDALKLNQKATTAGDMYSGDWRYRKSFLVFTEKEHALSTKKIAYITLDELTDIIPSIKPISETIESEETEILEPSFNVTQVPTLKDLETVLNTVPSTFNHTAQRACKNLPYTKPTTNYEYWVLIGCACAHHEVLLQMCGRTADSVKVGNIFHAWSKRDIEGYTSEDDVNQKYTLLLNSTKQKVQANQQVTTMGTLAVIAKGCTIDFPDMIPSGKNKLRPDPASIKNLQTLITHDQLELLFDPMGGGVCFKGPENIITQWYCPSKDYLAMRPKGHSQVAAIPDMAIRFRPYMQNRYKYSVSAQQARDAIDHLCQSMRQENAFKSWIRHKPWDGISRFEAVCRSIHVPETDTDNRDVYYSYIRRSLLSMIGIHFWPQDAPKIPAMLVLTGPEYTYKSSWAEWLIPKHMGNYTATADIETVLTAGKEWQMFLSTKAVVVVNECEPMFTPKYEQKVKSSVDAETVTYRDPYAKHVLSRPRTALIIGTTNKANLFTGSTGTRKIWQIPVRECDSMLIKDMDLQQLYAEIYHILLEYKKTKPKRLIQAAWAQSETDRDKTNILNAERKGVDLGVLGLLIEKFGHFLYQEFDPKTFIGSKGLNIRAGRPADISNTPNAWTVSAMLKFLKFEFPDDKIDRTSVKYAIEEYSAGFTKTTHQPRTPFDSYVPSKRYHKVVSRGHITLSPTTGYYLMPAPLNLVNDDEIEVDADYEGLA